jgi:hypothetical protein
MERLLIINCHNLFNPLKINNPVVTVGFIQIAEAIAVDLIQNSLKTPTAATIGEKDSFLDKCMIKTYYGKI